MLTVIISDRLDYGQDLCPWALPIFNNVYISLLQSEREARKGEKEIEKNQYDFSLSSVFNEAGLATWPHWSCAGTLPAGKLVTPSSVHRALWVRPAHEPKKTQLWQCYLARAEWQIPREGHRKPGEWTSTRCPAVLCRVVWFSSGHPLSESPLVSLEDSGREEWHKWIETWPNLQVPTDKTADEKHPNFLACVLLLPHWGTSAFMRVYARPPAQQGDKDTGSSSIRSTLSSWPPTCTWPGCQDGEDMPGWPPVASSHGVGWRN